MGPLGYFIQVVSLNSTRGIKWLQEERYFRQKEGKPKPLLNRQEHWIKNSQDQVVAIPTQNYDYDSLNRLQRVYEGDPQTPDWHQSYVYDRWGNRTINQSTTTGIPKPYFGVDPNTNRLTVPIG